MAELHCIAYCSVAATRETHDNLLSLTRASNSYEAIPGSKLLCLGFVSVLLKLSLSIIISPVLCIPLVCGYLYSLKVSSVMLGPVCSNIDFSGSSVEWGKRPDVRIMENINE